MPLKNKRHFGHLTVIAVKVVAAPVKKSHRICLTYAVCLYKAAIAFFGLAVVAKTYAERLAVFGLLFLVPYRAAANAAAARFARRFRRRARRLWRTGRLRRTGLAKAICKPLETAANAVEQAAALARLFCRRTVLRTAAVAVIIVHITFLPVC